jgi:ATP-dependent DNA helicase RecG
LDKQLIRETAKLAVKSQRWQGSPDDMSSFLHAFGLTENESVTNAGLVLFGKQPARILPQARVRLLVLPEGKTANHYSLDRTFEGSLLRIAEEIPQSLSSYTGGVTSVFSAEKWQREDRALYPMSALREGVMNALVHRDYSLSGTITISVQPESIEITSPGGLPNELKPADLKRNHLSVPRNPDIAHICFLYGLIEKIGRGTQRIVEDCRRSRLRDPKWQSSALATSLTFFAPSGGMQNLRKEDLNERQLQIMSALEEHEYIRAGDINRLFGGEVTDRTIRTDLQVLMEDGWLVRRGRGRSTSYARGPKEE